MKILFVFVMLLLSESIFADSLLPPENPEQTLAYWKPFIVPVEKNNRVKQAHRVFTDLLKTWDGSRVEPVLYIVSSNSGPWAASLLDGTILLSESAIETSVKIAGDRYSHLLAFILAHELAHQRSDDLWHFKFFRLVGAQKPALQQKLLEGFSLNREKLLQLEKKEAQADQEGLTIMTLVGYDAAEITARHDFFKAWVENIWQQSCEQPLPATSNQQRDITAICKQAGVRTARARAHLKKLSLDSNLYQLGIEAYVAGKYRKARKYFKAYGRLFPGNVVLNSIGLTYLAAVMDIDRKLYEMTGQADPGYLYPVLLDMQPVFFKPKRGMNRAVVEKLKQEKKRLVSQAVQVFERSLRLAPAYRPAYLHLVISFILNKNQPMASGILLGKYQQRFGKDFEFQLLSALIKANTNDHGEKLQAKQMLQKLTGAVLEQPDRYRDMQVFSAVKNTAAILEQLNKSDQAADEIQRHWRYVAGRAKQFSDPSLFLLAVNALNKNTAEILREPDIKLKAKTALISERRKMKKAADSFWFEGEKIFRWQTAEGDRYLYNEQGEILSTHVVASNSKLQELGLFTRDKPADLSRVYARFGLPDRRVFLLNGQFIAYDKAGVAIQLVDNKIAGWFYY